MIEPQDVAAILLAAGQSKRFGDKDKLSQPVRGVPIVMHTARRIVELNTGPRIAVCRKDWPLAEELAQIGFDIRINPDPERGLSSSLALGIATAAQTPAHAALVLLGDMPFVGGRHLRKMLARFDRNEAPVVASSREGIAMPPALFARSHFDQLCKAEGDQGGQFLLRQGVLVPGDPCELDDIDRQADLP